VKQLSGGPKRERFQTDSEALMAIRRTLLHSPLDALPSPCFASALMQIKKVKVFSEDSASDLEQVVNEWFAQNPNVEIIEVLQSQSCNSPGGVTTITFSIAYFTTQAA
jgi:hypothetical protein